MKSIQSAIWTASCKNAYFPVVYKYAWTCKHLTHGSGSWGISWYWALMLSALMLSGSAWPASAKGLNPMPHFCLHTALSWDGSEGWWVKEMLERYHSPVPSIISKINLWLKKISWLRWQWSLSKDHCRLSFCISLSCHCIQSSNEAMSVTETDVCTP